MPSCLRALGFRKKKSKAHLTTTTNEKPKVAHPGSAPGATKVPPLEEVPHAEVSHVQSTGVPVRPGVNPLYSAYSTPVNTRWADSAAAPPRPSDGMVESADKAVDPEEAALRKAAQEEQERLDFFQM
ncbi:hypothetical protein MYCTH_2305452, partial [Thermothelomyces thermophilus ATCC 42464]